jgi:hypothetical protein
VEDVMNGDYFDSMEFDPDFDGCDFAEPGGRSALRASRKGNRRTKPCPTCGAKRVLTPADVALGYQCNACADRDEGIRRVLAEGAGSAGVTHGPVPSLGRGRRGAAMFRYVTIDSGRTYAMRENRMWQDVQACCRVQRNDAKLRLTRIARDDGGCCYSAPGEYTIRFVAHGWEEMAGVRVE